MREQDWPDEAREAMLAAMIRTREFAAGVAFGVPADARDDFAAGLLNAALAALAPHVTPTAPLRDLVEKWNARSAIAADNNVWREVGQCFLELREVLDP